MKRLLYLALILLSVWLIARKCTHIPVQTMEAQEKSSPLNQEPLSAAGSGGTVTATQTDQTVVFSADAQSQITSCIGHGVENIEKLERILLNRGGPLKQRYREWKTVEYRDRDGNPFRIRIDRDTTESGQAEEKTVFYSVDLEGLPTKIPPPKEAEDKPSKDWLDAFLADKTVERSVESEAYDFQSGKHIRVESENGNPVEIESNNGGLSCSVKQGHDSCHCGRAGAEKEDAGKNSTDQNDPQNAAP